MSMSRFKVIRTCIQNIIWVCQCRKLFSFVVVVVTSSKWSSWCSNECVIQTLCNFLVLLQRAFPQSLWQNIFQGYAFLIINSLHSSLALKLHNRVIPLTQWDLWLGVGSIFKHHLWACTSSGKKLLILFEKQPMGKHRNKEQPTLVHWRSNSFGTSWDAKVSLKLNELKFFLQTCTLTPSMHGKLTEHGKEPMTESPIELKENVKSSASFGNQLANKKRPFLETPKVLWNRTVISDIESVDMLVVL